jgi:hypothetical protein
VVELEDHGDDGDDHKMIKCLLGKEEKKTKIDSRQRYKQ